MHEEADSNSTESPSNFSYLGNGKLRSKRAVPGSKYLIPGENTLSAGQSPSVARVNHMPAAQKLNTVNTYIAMSVQTGRRRS